VRGALGGWDRRRGSALQLLAFKGGMALPKTLTEPSPSNRAGGKAPHESVSGWGHTSRALPPA